MNCKNNPVDAIAAAKKLEIEYSCLTRDEKDIAKAEVDAATEIAKLLVPYSGNKPSAFGMDLSAIARIKECAEQCGVDKVTLIPLPKSINNGTTLIRCYGGSYKTFFARLDMNETPSGFSDERDLISEYEKYFGVIVYERKK